MKPLHQRTSLGMFAVAFGILVTACGSGGGHTFRRLSISSGEVLATTYQTAFEVLTHHRELIVFEDRIGFRGGDDRDGLDRQTYSVPVLMVNGNRNLNDPVTVLRGITAEEITAIQLWRASMVPPQFRRPGWEGGVIWVRTR